MIIAISNLCLLSTIFLNAAIVIFFGIAFNFKLILIINDHL